VVDYATGTTGALAISSALFQRERTGRGQHIDLAMLDVALVMMSADMTNTKWSGQAPTPSGNDMKLAGARCYETADGLLMVGAMNRQQHRRLFNYFGHPEIAEVTDYPPRFEHGDDHAEIVQARLLERSAKQWEVDLQQQHIPAMAVRDIAEAMDDEQLETRKVLHDFENFRGSGQTLSVPVAAFKYLHGGPEVTTPPPAVGEDTEAVLLELGRSQEEIALLRKNGTV